MPWFHAGQSANGHWDPNGFTARYKEEVRSIRAGYLTTKTKTGLDENGEWIPSIHQSRKVFVRVNKYDWGRVENFGRNASPVFNITFQVAIEKTTTSVFATLFGQPKAPTKEVFINTTLRMLFPTDYHYSPPLIYTIDHRLSRIEASNSHHILQRGQLCIFEGHGDWNVDKDNACSAFKVGVEWSMLHFINHGF